MRRLFVLLFAVLIPLALYAQTDMGVWTEVAVEKAISKKWDAALCAEVRSTDGVRGMDRWSLGVSTDFAPVKMLSVGAGYMMIDSYSDQKLTRKGNVVGCYWQLKNRLYTNVRLRFRPKFLRLSARFRYQYTHESAVSVAKYSLSGVRKSNELIAADGSHFMRTKIEVAAKTKSLFSPFVSYEVFNDLQDGFALSKSRLELGTDIKLSKHHLLSVSYKSNFYSDDDSDKTHHVLGVGYKFDF